MAIKNHQYSNHPGTLPRAQTGAVLLAMVLIIMIGSAYYLVTKLNTNLEKTQHSQETGMALKAAKNALIGYAVSYPENVDSSFGPGYLPCPDRNNDGSTDPGSCSLNGTTSIGRFPYKTLETKDFRDSHGERLWYVVSDNFRNNPKMIPLNSETAESTSGDLTVNGYTNIAAVIFAADAIEDSQDRSTANKNNYVHYIEATLSDSHNDGDIDTVTTGSTDRYILLTKDELMQMVEKRVLGEVKQVLITYRDNTDWNNDNIYPWMSEFKDPLTSLFKGKVKVRQGHLDIHWMDEVFTTEFKANWHLTNAIINVWTGTTVSSSDLTKGKFTDPAGTCIWLGDPAQADCSRSISPFALDKPCLGEPKINIERTYRFEFTNNDPQGDELMIEEPKKKRARRRSLKIDIDPLPPRVNSLNITIIDIALNGSNIGDECDKGTLTLDSGVTGGKFNLERIHYGLDVPNEMPEWFVDNEWHHLIYVAISKDMIPDKGESCVGKDSCLSLIGDNPSSDNEAIVIVAGEQLGTQDRAGAVTPPVDMADYFELDNNNEDDVYEFWKDKQNINDQVKVIPD